MSDLYEEDIYDEVDDDEDDTLSDRYLTFKVGDEEYGIEIRYVIEIVGLMKITPLPETANYIKGVVNLRGKVIPVIDMRLRFGLNEIEYDMKTCIVVVKINDKEKGIIVDNVSEVMEIDPKNIDSAMDGDDQSNRFVSGLGKVGEEIKILLDLIILLGNDEKIQSLQY